MRTISTVEGAGWAKEKAESTRPLRAGVWCEGQENTWMEFTGSLLSESVVALEVTDPYVAVWAKVSLGLSITESRSDLCKESQNSL